MEDKKQNPLPDLVGQLLGGLPPKPAPVANPAPSEPNPKLKIENRKSQSSPRDKQFRGGKNKSQ